MIEPELASHFCDLVVLVRREECDPDARAAGAARAADPVHVGFAVGGRIEIDHVGDPLYVDPAGRDVRRHKGVDLAGLEAGEGLLALAL
jgi:hypothetical protein